MFSQREVVNMEDTFESLLELAGQSFTKIEKCYDLDDKNLHNERPVIGLSDKDLETEYNECKDLKVIDIYEAGDGVCNAF